MPERKSVEVVLKREHLGAYRAIMTTAGCCAIAAVIGLRPLTWPNEEIVFNCPLLCQLLTCELEVQNTEVLIHREKS